MTKASKPRKKSEKQLLVESLLKKSQGCNWPLEMKMVGHLLKRIPNSAFWFYFGERHKYPTLVHLLSDTTTTNIVALEYQAYTKNKLELEKVTNTHQLPQNNVGEDIIIEQPRIKTLKDFISGI